MSASSSVFPLKEAMAKKLPQLPSFRGHYTDISAFAKLMSHTTLGPLE
jgi:hypothetical protein